MKRDKQAEKVAFLVSIGYTVRRSADRSASGVESWTFLTMDGTRTSRRVYVSRDGRVSELRTAERDPSELEF